MGAFYLPRGSTVSGMYGQVAPTPPAPNTRRMRPTAFAHFESREPNELGELVHGYLAGLERGQREEAQVSFLVERRMHHAWVYVPSLVKGD